MKLPRLKAIPISSGPVILNESLYPQMHCHLSVPSNSFIASATYVVISKKSNALEIPSIDALRIFCLYEMATDIHV